MSSVSMSAVWLKIAITVSLFYTAHTEGDKKGVVWKTAGEDITIFCNGSSDQEYLALKKGLHQDDQIVFAEKNSKKITIAKEMTDRLQTDKTFPKMSIRIKNLTVSDTGPYWCVYKKYKGTDEHITIDHGSRLLVVTGIKGATPVPGVVQRCESLTMDLVMVFAAAMGAVLVSIFLAFTIWIIFTRKHSGTRVSSKRLPNNDVYEDMRGTLKH